MTRSVIVSAVRTPFGRLGGGLAEYEALVRAELHGTVARVRPEWSKNLAYTAEGPNRDLATIAAIREMFRHGRPGTATWDAAARTFERLDPHGVFTIRFLDVLFERG